MIGNHVWMPNLDASSSALVLQGLLAALVVFAIAIVPPAEGFMLIVPLQSTSRPVDAAIRAGALLVSAGPIAGSVIVRGDRNRIIAPAMADGNIVIATGERGCAEPRAF